MALDQGPSRMTASLHQIVDLYDASRPLAEASTIPAPWYTDPRIAALERQGVFTPSWQVVGRTDQLHNPGDYVTADIVGEPVLVVRGSDGVLRGFFNVCRHHAAAVMTAPCGNAKNLRCPYHGWTYTLEGTLKGTPQFAGVRQFDPTANGLVPLEIGQWETFVFARVARDGPSLAQTLDAPLVEQIHGLGLRRLHWFERRRYGVECNWKV
jgi:choline monooxygenase